MIGEICAEAQVSRAIKLSKRYSIVGNTAMHHLLAGLPVHQLGTSPNLPVISDALEIRACRRRESPRPRRGITAP